MLMCENCSYSSSHDEDFRKPCPGCIGKKCFEYDETCRLYDKNPVKEKTKPVVQ